MTKIRKIKWTSGSDSLRGKIGEFWIKIERTKEFDPEYDYYYTEIGIDRFILTQDSLADGFEDAKKMATEYIEVLIKGCLNER